MKKTSDRRILAILSTWPSQQHPYIIFLLAELKIRFPNMELFLFRRGENVYADRLLGFYKQKMVLQNVFYKFQVTYNPIEYIIVVFNILKSLKSSIALFEHCRDEGKKVYQAIGQLIYYHEILGKNYDLVYINALQLGRHLCIRGLFQNTPVVASSRGQDFDLDPNGFDRVLTQIDHLHVLGNYLKNKAIGRGFSSDRITIIPPASLPCGKVDLKKKQNYSKGINIVSASRLVWTKGYIYALRAFKGILQRLGDVDIHYHIIGDGPQKEFILAEAHRMKIAKKITLHGWQTQDKVTELVSSGDIYLLLSIEEGFNNSVLQAQGLGLPCVVSDAGGLPENVADGITGFVVPRYNVGAATDALINLILNKNLRRGMGLAAKERVEDKFTLDKQVDAYTKMFKQQMKLR